MIRFEIKKNTRRPGEFSYDLKALALSFFPEKTCEVVCLEDWEGKAGYPLRCYVEGELMLEEEVPEGYTKNVVNKALYHIF